MAPRGITERTKLTNGFGQEATTSTITGRRVLETNGLISFVTEPRERNGEAKGPHGQRSEPRSRPGRSRTASARPEEVAPLRGAAEL